MFTRIEIIRNLYIAATDAIAALTFSTHIQLLLYRHDTTTVTRFIKQPLIILLNIHLLNLLLHPPVQECSITYYMHNDDDDDDY